MALGAALLASAIAEAHHSFAMFDHDKAVSYQATVRTWEFTNPHAYLWVYIDSDKGLPELWGLEGPGPAALLRKGWSKSTVKPGDKITVEINPLLDGRHGGNLTRISLPDGRSLDVGLLPNASGAATQTGDR